MKGGGQEIIMARTTQRNLMIASINSGGVLWFNDIRIEMRMYDHVISTGVGYVNTD
jgi:hypothetical protein